MGLGPHPVERARSGGAVGVRRTPQRPPPPRRRRPATPHMSGVGAPAIRPRNSVRPRKSGPGHGPGYMSGVGAPAVRPRPVARARKRPPLAPCL
eukprot:gene20588-biopygen23575